MTKLIFGLVLFFGIHSISIIALGWRNRMAELVGAGLWQAVYSIASLAGFFLVVTGYGNARLAAEVLYVPPLWLHYVAALLMLPAFTLALASLLPGRIQMRTRHPLLIATKLWALSHLLTNGSLADVLLFGSFLVWAGVVRISLKYRPARPIRTLPASRANDAIAIVGGLTLYVVFVLWLHVKLFGVPPIVSG